MLLSLLLWVTLLCHISDGQASSQKHKRSVWTSSMRTLDPVIDPYPTFAILAPAKIRPGTKQNILLESQNLSGALKVTIEVNDYPVSQSVLLRDSVVLESDNNYSVLKSIVIDPNMLRPDGKKKYVKLVARFGAYHRAEQVLAVSFRTGHIFIQTDKPVYNPGDAVRFRVFLSDSEFRASERIISFEIQNPDGIAIHGSSRVKVIGGKLSDVYQLSTVVKEGKWKVVAKFDQGKENSFSREFEVKKYVLPAFNVTLTPKTPHLDVDADKLEVEITARYLYGEPVQGVAYVLFGIEINGEKNRLTSMKQLNDLNEGIVSLTMEEIKKVYPDIKTLVGSSVYVKASVMTSSGSDLVEAEKSGIKIVISPYVLSIKDTPKYFKPGLPLGMTVLLRNHDGSPVPNIPVKISFLESPISSHSGTIKVHINMPKTTSSFGNSQILKVETANPSLRPEQQAVEEMHVEPYSSFTSHKNYLHLSEGANRVEVGNTFNVQAYIKSATGQEKLVEQLTYAVLNKGNIIHAGRMNVKDLNVINIPLMVTTEMLPAFRIVAYYILPWKYRAEVVADSLFIDVEDRCVGSLSVGPVPGEILNSNSPGDAFRFQVKGDPGATVSLVAVDNAVFLLSKNRLTQKKVWEVVAQGDMGCTTGGGRNNMGVFTDAGLMFYSGTGGSTDYKKDCSSSSRRRRRRSAAKLQIKEQLEKVYSDKLLQRCCVDGMREIPMPYSCYRRSLYITEDWSCVLAFLRCCAEYRGEELGVITRPPTTTLPPTTLPPTTTSFMFYDEIAVDYFTFLSPNNRPRMPTARFLVPHGSARLGESGHSAKVEEEEEEEEEEFDEADLEDIYVRSKFFESWLWTDIKLPNEPKSDGLAVHVQNTVLPDSITQWGFLAISSSTEKGFCVAEPYNVRAWKPFFVDLRLPHSVSRNEHVQVKAVIHNYRNSKLKVMVILDKTEDMCSVAFTGPHRQQVSVPASSSKLITYTIIPLKTGELPLQVTAITAPSQGQDAVRKNLLVVVEGIQTIKVRSFVLNPTEKGYQAGSQIIGVEKMQLDAVVPNSVPETSVNVRGNLLADSIDNSFKEDSLGALIRMPGGCVEQNLATITLPLIAAHYLDRSANWDAVGIDRRVEAIKYIQKGYENQLNYQKTDYSYPPYAKEGTSTWITAYVVKVFSMAYSFISVDDKHLCGTLLYLLKNKQLSDGSFKEDNPVYDTSMTGGLQGSESRVSLTAFVLIALAEAKEQESVTCQDPDLDIQDKTRKAATYIRERFPQLTRPYSAAIACYALAVSNYGCMKSMLLKLASPDRTHWPDSDNHFFSLEATGYALLALLKSGHMEEAAAPFQWLSENRGVGGGYGSTQSTIVVLQALSEYLVKSPPLSDLNLMVQLSVPGRSDERWNFNPTVAYVARSSRVPIDQEFTVVASGKGKGILEVVTVYHQLPDVYENSTCKGFQLDVSIAETNEKNPPDVEKSYRLNIHVRAVEGRQVRMAILDISLPTGFEPENSDLELLTNSVDRYINNFQVVDNLSDRGSLIIHLFKVSSTETDLISFRLNQKFKVGLLQPSTVTVYQYYNKDKRCSRFYSPPEDQQQLNQICKDDVCRCSQGDCCVMKEDSGSFGIEKRKEAVCNGLHHAYRVKLISSSKSHYDQYEMEIVQVIKEGTEEGLKEKEKRMFLSHASCRAGLSLKEGQHYLIIGPITDVWQAGSMSNRYAYTLGKNTWVERWPAESECGDGSALQLKCQELESFATTLTESGCQS